jgi:hypothetical protein
MYFIMENSSTLGKKVTDTFLVDKNLSIKKVTDPLTGGLAPFKIMRPVRRNNERKTETGYYPPHFVFYRLCVVPCLSLFRL